MSPRTPEQFEEMRENRRLQIMQTALKLFALEGYGHCSVSMLASEAGISKGLMYNYFESKSSLLSAIVDHGMGEFMDLFDPNHDGVLDKDEFKEFIRKIFTVIRDHKEYWILFISVILQPKVRELLQEEYITRYVEGSIEMLFRYFEKQGFEDPLLEVITFSSLIEGFGALLIYTYPTFDIPDVMLDRFENRIIEMYT
jgi:AcrR family transcriptional regulator